MLNRVRAVGYVFCSLVGVVGDLRVQRQLEPGVPGAGDGRGGGVRVGVVDAIGLDVQGGRRLNGLVDVVRRGKSVTANWSIWSELFSSATCAVALSPVSVTGLGSLAALVFMFAEQLPLLPTPELA